MCRILHDNIWLFPLVILTKFSLFEILSRASISSFCGFDSSVLSFSFFDEEESEDARGVVVVNFITIALFPKILECEKPLSVLDDE